MALSSLVCRAAISRDSIHGMLIHDALHDRAVRAGAAIILRPNNTSLDIYPRTMISEFKTCNREGLYDE
jgi:hypothetical protein